MQEIYAPLTPDDFYIYYIYDTNDDARLQDFRPVDIFKADACVGLLHDAQRSPHLYHFEERGWPRLLPLEVDIQGYMNLLQLTLGFLNWQSLLVELASPRGLARPFTLDADRATCDTLRMILPRFLQVYPDFSLEEFVARYDQVKLAPGI
ncbi:hypothetical protein Q5H93_03460 [Hymenobacter sp. ASUV-10]|uniref:Uncharacterized protein n=1 Tax=Hymenobacter aranciens TaxID=3063996 RepID=A0ABT9BAQ7_9BACT|nr:hypothetical protein [Hymenobacter sp. ASUV-10]MDO7873776.1 hypothetical protein [Hymenobacter sp. ASUV-10]